MPSCAVIELLGVPAAGKSGLARALGSAPGTVVVKEHGARDLPALLAAVIRGWPAVLRHAPPPGTSRLRWAAWTGRLGAAGPVTGRRSADARLVVLDQGPAYTLGRMLPIRHGTWGDHWWHRQACATARLLDLLVLLEAEPEVLAGRLRGRSKEHLAASLDTVATLRYLTSEQQVCHVVTDVLDRAGVRVLRLDTGRLAPEEQVEAVRAALGAGMPRGRSA